MAKLIPGYNDLQTCFPDIAAQWCYEKNGGLRPSEVTRASNQFVWWKCRLGHEWQAKISSRTSSLHTGCPYCANKKVLAGFNDLQTWHPDAVAEWNFKKNGDLLPSQVTSSSNKTVWWKCSLGHEWQAKISSRTREDKSGCPCCAGQRAISGENDLQTCFPEIAAEWNEEKNGDFTPDQVMSGSNKKVWWKCSLGHEWQACVHSRTGKDKTGCPYCAGKILIPGQNDLQTWFPDIAAEWNFEKNGGLTPCQVMPGSHQKVWWKCSLGHEWQAKISNRTSSLHTGCPCCKKTKTRIVTAERKILYGKINSREK